MRGSSLDSTLGAVSTGTGCSTAHRRPMHKTKQRFMHLWWAVVEFNQVILARVLLELSTLRPLVLRLEKELKPVKPLLFSTHSQSITPWHRTPASPQPGSCSGTCGSFQVSQHGPSC